MKKPLGAQISRMLKARGVEVIFGIPGVHNIEMYRGLEEAGLTHVLARHEQGAAFMADGYARATGRPGVAYVITGPGVCNAMTALGQAYADSVPVLLLASCLDETAFHLGQLHQMKDQRAAADCVCDWSLEARTPEAAYGLIDRALSEFGAARPRPKAIHVPIATLAALADGFPSEAPRAHLPHAPQERIYQAIQRIFAAERPLFVFGGGASGAAEVIPDLLHQTGAAAFTTYAGRGLVPPGHPSNFGAYLARPESARIAAAADLIVAVGTELSQVDLWRDALGHQAPVIRIDIDPGVLAGGGPQDMPILGDAAQALRAMSVAIPARYDDRAPCWDAARIAATRAAWRAGLMAERPHVVEIAEAVQQVMPEDAMIYSDMTQFAYAAKEGWDMPRAGHWHHPSGFGTLGYALPAAIGGAVARPGLPTLAIAGDYGLQFTVQELGTAVELGLSLPILLWDNEELGEIKDAMTAAQIAPNAVVARNPDFPGLAKAYGARACRPGSLSALQEAVTDAFDAPGPTLIHMTPKLTG